jgi:hypothetical protein
MGVVCSNCRGHKNNQVYKISGTKTKARVGLTPNLNPKMIKTRTRTRQVKDKNSRGFYCKNKIRTK